MLLKNHDSYAYSSTNHIEILIGNKIELKIENKAEKQIYQNDRRFDLCKVWDDININIACVRHIHMGQFEIF